MRKPEVLKACRFAAGLTVSSAAAVLNAEPAEIVDWEESGLMSEDPQKESSRYMNLCKSMDSRVGGIVRDLIDKKDEHSKSRFADWVIEIAGLMEMAEEEIVSIGQRIVDRTQLVGQRPTLPEFAGHRLVEEFRLGSPTLSIELSSIQRKKLRNCLTFERLVMIGQKFEQAFDSIGLQAADHVGTTLTHWSIDDDSTEDNKQCNCTVVSYIIDKSGVIVTALNRVVRHLKPGPIVKFKVTARGSTEEWKENLIKALQSGMK